ncbi:glycosyltransferase family 4 protein [Methylomicrobium sp. Wu6]|uniref:glycosyltransferase family 4 protein n=1 Tax=Methylomicrobium sp. Wu6 TaxID=3107928 RepID=UPI002DD6B3FB|nr:glycosyltransferase family 4 protein [Methylomicrobium sp. Wu6]MEC4749590.1 glycosyltransferase family 4 protein [Methylomicrobium sp. Wu6]
MKILVFVHQLDIGGTLVNSIELAAALRDFHGCDVVFFATPGPMVRLIVEKGLRFLPAPTAPFFPSPARMSALRDAVRRERPDLIHVWELWPCVDTFYAVHLPMRIPMLVTDMQMNVTRLLPKGLPTTFGIPELVDKAKAMSYRRVELLLPPVDVNVNAPGVVDPTKFRREYGIRDSDITLVTVSRLVEEMKSESLFRTISAVRTLGRDLPLRFVIVGDGTARAKLERLADEINDELGRPAVVLAGARLDPRPAYASADIVVGMGGSALRGMAFGKPVIIVGEQGFSAPLTPQTAESFYYKGIFGRGNGHPSNARLVEDIRWLAEHPDDQLVALGQFSRQFVQRSFSLEEVASRLAEFCRAAVADMPRLHETAFDGLRTAAVYLRERKFFMRSSPPEPTEIVER